MVIYNPLLHRSSFYLLIIFAANSKKSATFLKLSNCWQCILAQGSGNLLSISPIQRPHYITSSYTDQFFEKKYLLYRFKGEGLLSTLLHLICSFNIVTRKNRVKFLIFIFHACKKVCPIC